VPSPTDSMSSEAVSYHCAYFGSLVFLTVVITGGGVQIRWTSLV